MSRTILMLPIFLAAMLVFGPVPRAHAAVIVEAAPVIIDLKAEARDIIAQEVRLKNLSTRKLTLYASVNNVTTGPDGGLQAFADWSNADTGASLANWIEISRGVIELLPGEERTIPFTVRVNLNARPGVYHAQLAFADGSNVDEARANIRNGATIMVNLTIAEHVVEFMQLKRFTPSDLFSGGSQVAFAYEFENIGNRPLVPKGDILVYNRRGKEIGSIPVNPLGEAIMPGETKQLASAWEGASGIGRFKAYLDASYGGDSPARITDTTYFFVAPWPYILTLFLVLAVLVAIFAMKLHARTVSRPALQYVRRDTPSVSVLPEPLSMPKAGHPTAHISVLNMRSPATVDHD